MAMEGYDLIHDVVVNMSELSPSVRKKVQVQVLTEEGDLLDIVGVEYDPVAGIICLRAELAE